MAPLMMATMKSTIRFCVRTVQSKVELNCKLDLPNQVFILFFIILCSRMLKCLRYRVFIAKRQFSFWTIAEL
jgi:hypothetical protein